MREVSNQGVIIRYHSRPGTAHGLAERGINQTYLLEFFLHDILVEWLHDVFVCTGLQRARNMRDIILGRAKNDFGPLTTRKAP
jgi:hypothetical protein